MPDASRIRSRSSLISGACSRVGLEGPDTDSGSPSSGGGSGAPRGGGNPAHGGGAVGGRRGRGAPAPGFGAPEAPFCAGGTGGEQALGGGGAGTGRAASILSALSSVLAELSAAGRGRALRRRSRAPRGSASRHDVAERRVP